MGYEATGVVHRVFDTKQISDKFRKRSFVLSIADNPKYPQLCEMELTGDRCSNLDGINEGDTVHVEFSLRGREWKSPSGDTKYFVSLDVWKLDVKEKGAARPEPVFGGFGGSAGDDIPFASCSLSHEPSPIAKVLR